MDALNKRVRAFTGGIVVMVCPVLLAVALKKVDLKSQGSGSLRGGITPLAAFTLETGLLPFLCLCLSKLLSEGFADVLFRASKVLVHLCGLLLMALAYGILLLISVRNNLAYLAVLTALAPLTLWRCYWSTRNGYDHDAVVYEGCDGKLETSLEFSTAVTTLLFLGLEALALEGQNSSAQGLERMLTVALGTAFVTCAFGVYVMLLGTVPPLIADNSDSKIMCNAVEALNIALAIAVAAIVFLITFMPLGEVAWMVFVPVLLSFVVWMYKALVCDCDQVLSAGREEEFKPASLELTKVTFTGFLAVSVPTFRNSSIGNYTHCFILLTATAVISGLGWRLLTHRMTPSRALVTAANVSAFCAHLCVAAAVLPFATMAVNALK